MSVYDDSILTWGLVSFPHRPCNTKLLAVADLPREGISLQIKDNGGQINSEGAVLGPNALGLVSACTEMCF